MININRLYYIVCIVIIILTTYIFPSIIKAKEEIMPYYYNPVNYYSQYVDIYDIINYEEGSKIHINDNNELNNILIISKLEDKYLTNTILWIKYRMLLYNINANIYYNIYDDGSINKNLFNIFIDNIGINIRDNELLINMPTDPFIIILYVDNNNQILYISNNANPKMLDQAIKIMIP